MKSNLRVIVHPRCIVRAAIVLILLAFALCRPNLEAQVGNNNPGGVSGIFNGQVTTGCAYDPFTGNASRSVTDIVVAGAVGEYPLALVRYRQLAHTKLYRVVRLRGRLESQLQLGYGRFHAWQCPELPSGALHG